MKKEKVVKKDNIKDKYTKKVGFFKKLQIKFNILKEKIKLNKDLTKEASIASIMVLEIVTYGVLGSLSMCLFGLNVSVLTFFGIGSFLWLVENKFVNSASRLLSSIKLVEVKR